MAESDTATSLAGVGIFFQQDCDSNEVFVKTIVKGGSADRSGVLRVGDVVVRVSRFSTSQTQTPCLIEFEFGKERFRLRQVLPVLQAKSPEA
jgi:C-terminal processing protease CtpA/Prc